LGGAGGRARRVSATEEEAHAMRERYEREEGVRRADRWRDEMPRGGADGSPESRGAERRDDGGWAGREDERGDDWGDVQIGRWAGGRHRPGLRDQPGRCERDESHWDGTAGLYGRDLDREPSGSAGYGSSGPEERRWRYGPPDFDRDWQAEGGGPDGRTVGRFDGVGPKGYQRSDDRIREDVCDRLTADTCVDPSDVDVRVKDGEVTLEGTIDSRETKRRVEDTVEDVAGVRQVHNFLHVRNLRGAPSGTEPPAFGGGRRT
jgi:hypothetical protein